MRECCVLDDEDDEDDEDGEPPPRSRSASQASSIGWGALPGAAEEAMAATEESRSAPMERGGANNGSRTELTERAEADDSRSATASHQPPRVEAGGGAGHQSARDRAASAIAWGPLPALPTEAAEDTEAGELEMVQRQLRMQRRENERLMQEADGVMQQAEFEAQAAMAGAASRRASSRLRAEESRQAVSSFNAAVAAQEEQQACCQGVAEGMLELGEREAVQQQLQSQQEEGDAIMREMEQICTSCEHEGQAALTEVSKRKNSSWLHADESRQAAVALENDFAAARLRDSDSQSIARGLLDRGEQLLDDSMRTIERRTAPTELADTSTAHESPRGSGSSEHARPVGLQDGGRSALSSSRASSIGWGALPGLPEVAGPTTGVAAEPNPGTTSSVQ